MSSSTTLSIPVEGGCRPTERQVAVTDGIAFLREELEQLIQIHLPSRHPFFAALRKCATEIVSDPQFLGEFLHRYQAAMHSTRTMAYFLPFLAAPALRKRKLKILVDDDGLRNGDTHHYQLTRAFVAMGAQPKFPDESYAELTPLEANVDVVTSRFIAVVRKLYPRSLGAWVIVELLSHDWLKALAEALAVHHPHIREEPYFADCFNERIEERHGTEALCLLELVSMNHPDRLSSALADAREMAAELDLFWSGLLALIRARAQISDSTHDDNADH